MLKYQIGINELTDPGPALRKFRDACARAGVSDPDGLYKQVEHAVNELSDRGSQLASVGSHFNITRTLEGDDFRVVLSATFGAKPSPFTRMRNLFGI